MGNVYVADRGNHTIRKITPDGTVSTLAGTAGKAGSADNDNNSGVSLFRYPAGVATDSANNVYVADTENDTIRKIAPDGKVSTLAGAAGQIGNSDGNLVNGVSTARFSRPGALTTDSAGNLYVADRGNDTIRMITPGGTVTTVVGTPGARGVRLGSLPGSINGPWALTVLPGQQITLLEVDSENAVLQITLP